jgi:hypothetical protein
MTHWAEEIVSNAEWALVRDAFEKQFEALGSPRDMMLIAVEGQADATRLIIGLPDDISLSPYDGFAVISGASLPRTASVQIGHKDRFEELFEYPNP